MWGTHAYVGIMRYVLALCLTLIAAPALAQDAPNPVPESPPPPLMDQVEGLMQKFLERFAPQMQQMEEGLSALEPDLLEFMGKMRDMVQYYPPEVLPNGDILIRRRQPSDQPPPADVPDGDAPVVTPFEL